MKFIIASTNNNKIREFRFFLSKFPNWDIQWLSHFPQFSLSEENGNSFSEVAEAKALVTAKAFNCIALGDDSGLVVPALNGEPGIISRRYAGDNASDHDNRTKLLSQMAGFENEARHAYMECAIALASPQGILKTVTATCEGYVLEQPRGNFGFGYDAIFARHDHKSFGEISEDIKNRISHRFKAFEKLLPYLQTL